MMLRGLAGCASCVQRPHHAKEGTDRYVNDKWRGISALVPTAAPTAWYFSIDIFQGITANSDVKLVSTMSP